MKKSIFLFFATLLCATSAWAWSISSGKVYYFKPSSDWKSSGARFAAAFGTNDDTWYWYSCQKVQGETDLYYVISNGDYDWMIFCRMNPSTSDNNWNNKWTEAVRVYPNNGYNRFDIKTDNSWSNDFNWYKYAPPMSSVTLSDNGTSIYGGNGTSSNPYLVAVGSTIKVKASGTKAVADPDAQIYYNFKQGTSSKQNNTNTTYEFTSSTTAGTTYTINLDGYTKISSTSSTTKSATALYFKTITPTIKFAGDMTDWGNDAKEFTLNGTTATLDIDLTQGIHKFKIIEIYNSNETWLGNKGQMSRKNCTDWVFRNKKEDKPEEDEINCKILVEVEGTYTFSWNILTQELSVKETPEFDLSSQPDIIYFQPSEAWKTSNARFAAYFCYGDKNTEEKWADLEDKDGDGVYEVANEKKHSVIIFVRMNPAHNTNKWENDYNWNQTADLFIPTNEDDRYTMTATGADNFDNSGKWSLVKHTISATADPVEGGSVEGANTYNYGTSVTITATPDTGYEFVNWTKAGVEVSTDASYTFTVTEDVDLVANFAKEEYTRTTTIDSYGTICLPFGSDDYSGAEFYEVAYLVEGTGLWLDQLAAGDQLVAGKPYIFKATATELVVVSNATEVEDPVDGAKGLTGTFTDIATGDAALVGNYIIAQNQIWIAGAGNSLPANRAYINALLVPKTEQAKLPGRRRVQMGENAATGLDNITNGENTVIKTIENGQLIIIRNGEKFNAQGVRL